MFEKIINYVRTLYPGQEFIPLHAPVMGELEKQYLSDCVDSTFVSSVGKYVGEFEKLICEFTGAKYAVATTNGTSALHTALLLSDVKFGDEVISQALTFVATTNSISQCGAHSVFIDSDLETYGMCPEKLEQFLELNCTIADNGKCFNKSSNRFIKACVPMHVFGRPVHIKRIQSICEKYNIVLVEDAAEALGSYINDEHVGLNGELGILSFNGNKTITCGGGGMIITNNEALAKRAKHITTTAKMAHPYEFNHDEVAFNYRLPNLNAAFACAQMQRLPKILANKRETASLYQQFFKEIGLPFSVDTDGTKSNYWLNSILLFNRKERDEFLKLSNDSGVMTRPVWLLMNKLKMYQECQSTNLDNANHLEDRLVNIPSSFRGHY